MSLQVPAPHQPHEQKRVDLMSLEVRINKRRYQAVVDDKKQATTINRAIAGFVLRGPALMNDSIIVPLEIKGRILDICCIVVDQKEKVIVGRQCLQAFGLLVGVVSKPSVHARLGPKVTKSKNHRGTQRNSNIPNAKITSSGRTHQGTRVWRTWSSRPEELKEMMYPGGRRESRGQSPEDVIEIHPNQDDLMHFD